MILKTLDIARHCEERSDEAISLKLQGVIDCFASLAMITYIASIFRKHSAIPSLKVEAEQPVLCAGT